MQEENNMKYAIVTGVSKGLGASAAKYMMESGIHLIGISRTKNEKLHVIAGENNVNFKHIEFNFSNLDYINNIIASLNENVFSVNVSHLYLINNAAVVVTIDQAEVVHPYALQHHYDLNVLAPVILDDTMINESNIAL